MTAGSAVDTTVLDASVQRRLGLSLADLRLLPDRSRVAAVAYLARHDGLDEALHVLDALADGEETLACADERVRLLLDAGQYDGAASTARARLTRKESLITRALLARALLNARDVDGAGEAADAMVAAAPDKVSPHYVTGLVALARHDTAAARASFERVLQIQAESPSGLRGLARTALAEGDAVSALDLAGQAMDRYEEPPPDLVRELLLYAERVDDTAVAARAKRRAEEARTAYAEAQAARDAALPERLAQELARSRERAERPSSSRSGSTRTRVEESDDEDAAFPDPGMAGAGSPGGTHPGEGDAASGRVAALRPAPPPDPAAHDRLVAALHDTFGFDAFRAGQEEVVSAVAAGHDILAVMPTGAGKSLCYQLPATLREGLTLVISPLIALMKDQVESLPPVLLAQTTLINSSLESAELDLRLSEIALGRYRLVYAAPERLRQRPFVHALSRAGVSLVVIDEAHCLSMWGHDFRPDYLFVRAVLPDLGAPQVLAMTATATPEMMVEIARQLGRDLSAVNTGVLRDNLYLMARHADNEDHKLRILLPFVQGQRGSGIVYVNSRDNAEKLERQLRQSGVNARAYHAGMGPAERSALQDRFMEGELRVMVATVAFGMGVDKADVRFIVHYNPARSLEAYSQESGRAGRDGKPAVCLLLHSPADRTNLKRWSREQAVDLDGLRAVYRLLRSLLRDGTGLVDGPTLRERLAAGGQSEIDLRVAISLLENAGLLRRGPDVPRGATVTLRQAQTGRADDDLTRFIEVARLQREAQGGADGRLSRPAPVDLALVASGMGVDAVTLEDRLLAWQDADLLSYHGVGRDMLIEMLPPPPDTAERMAAILDGMGRRNRRRLRSLFAYLDTDACRHSFISRHFGHQTAERCRRCDVCRPVTLDEVESTHAQRIDDPAEAIRLLVGQCPACYGKPGVVEVLKGAMARRLHASRTELFGALAQVPKATIKRAIDRLLEDGELLVVQRDGYAVLCLADAASDVQ